MSMFLKFNGERRQIGCLFAGILVKFGGRHMSEAGSFGVEYSHHVVSLAG